MCGNLADSNARLERLVEQIMKETDAVKYDKLGQKSGELSANASAL